MVQITLHVGKGELYLFAVAYANLGPFTTAVRYLKRKLGKLEHYTTSFAADMS